MPDGTRENKSTPPAPVPAVPSEPVITPEAEAAIVAAGARYCDNVRRALRLRANVHEVTHVPEKWVQRHCEREDRLAHGRFAKPSARVLAESAKMTGAGLLGAATTIVYQAFSAGEAVAASSFTSTFVLGVAGLAIWGIGTWRSSLS